MTNVAVANNIWTHVPYEILTWAFLNNNKCLREPLVNPCKLQMNTYYIIFHIILDINLIFVYTI